MNDFKNLKYGDTFFSVEGYDIVKYSFIHINEDYDKIGYFEKEFILKKITKFESVHIDNFLKFFRNEHDAKENIKENLFKELYSYQNFKNVNVESCEIKSFQRDENVFILFNDDLKIINGCVLKIKEREIRLNFEIYYVYEMIYDSFSHGPGYCYYDSTNKLFFKEIEDANAKLYELLCKKLTNYYSFNLFGYEFNEDEVIWIIDNDLKIEQKLMKKDEKFNGHGFFFEEHAKEFLKNELEKKLLELKEDMK